MLHLRQWAARLKTDVPALWLCLRSPDTPWYAKALAGLAVGYALSPLDLVPDFIPVLGYLDDLLVLPLLVTLAVRCIPAPVLARCRAQAQGLWAQGKPRRWYYALPIAAVWLLVAWVVVRAVVRWAA